MNCEEQSNSKDTYRFSYFDDSSDRNISFDLNIADTAPWWEVHQEMLGFLSAVYGFNISKELARYYQENAGSNCR